MDRNDAIARLRTLIGTDLRARADELGVTVWKENDAASVDGVSILKLNKGWAGHTIERFLGLPLNSSRAPNFGSWELKVIPLRYRKDGTLRVKETMAITMLDHVEVLAKEFEDSHLLTKLRKIVVVARIFEDKREAHSLVYSVAGFDLDNPETYAQVKADYNLIRDTLQTQGYHALRSEMGRFVQSRTKGAGHGSTSRAFYARTQFVAHIINLS